MEVEYSRKEAAAVKPLKEAGAAHPEGNGSGAGAEGFAGWCGRGFE